MAALALLAVSAGAADEQAPKVAGPADLPGADVILTVGEEYTLDATGSTDDTGVVGYQWEIYSPTNVRTSINSTAPTAEWAPTEYGIYKVVSWAADAAGNRGFYVFAIDVVEVIAAHTYIGGTYTYDHSVAVTSGTLDYQDCSIEVTGGKKAEAAAVTKGEMMSEDLVYRGGDLSGYWAVPYDESYYGKVVRDTEIKLVGAASIKVETGDYGYCYGGEYVFDSPADLSKYNTFVFWMRCEAGGYPDFYEVEMYAGGRSTSNTGYCYRYVYIYPPYTSGNGWYGVSISLDIFKVGYGYEYNFDTSQVGSIWCMMWSYYPLWIDCAYFSQETYGDNITESATPTGPWAGYWSCSGGSVATSTNRYVGSNSVQMSMSYAGYM